MHGNDRIGRRGRRLDHALEIHEMPAADLTIIAGMIVTVEIGHEIIVVVRSSTMRSASQRLCSFAMMILQGGVLRLSRKRR